MNLFRLLYTSFWHQQLHRGAESSLSVSIAVPPVPSLIASSIYTVVIRNDTEPDAKKVNLIAWFKFRHLNGLSRKYYAIHSFIY